MKKRILALLTAVVLFATLLLPATALAAVTITTQEATIESATSATFAGTITYEDADNVVQVGFGYYPTASGDDAMQWVVAALPASGESFSATATGLTAETEYTVMAYYKVEGNDNAVYGNAQTFTTIPAPVYSVTANEATNVTGISATLNATVESQNTTVTEAGFQYKTAEASDWTVLPASVSGTTLTADVTGLTPGTEYEFCAYAAFADVAGGYQYSDNVTFTTSQATHNITTKAATDVTISGATFNAELTTEYTTATEYGFEYRVKDTSQWTVVAGTLDGTALTATVTDLAPGTTYTVRSYAVFDGVDGKQYGGVREFTTGTYITVTTGEATDITAYSAVLHGAIEAGGIELTDDYGFQIWPKDAGDNRVNVNSVSSVPGEMTAVADNLQPGVVYCYQAYTWVNEGGEYRVVWAEETKEFTALGAPAFTGTATAADVTISSANLSVGMIGNGYVFTEGGFFLYEDDPAAAVYYAGTINAGNDQLTLALTGLKAGTTYHFYPVAEYHLPITRSLPEDVDNENVIKGDVQSFTTNSAPIVSTGIAKPVSYYEVDIFGSVNSGAAPAGVIDEYGFEYKLANAKKWTVVKLDSGLGNIYTRLVDLKANNTYQYRAYAIAEGTTFYGDTLTFTTKQVNDPITDWTDTTVRYSIYASNSAGGSISPSGVYTVRSGASATYVIVPNTGYRIKDVVVDGVSLGVRSLYTFDNIKSNHTIYASFTPVQNQGSVIVTPPTTGGGTITIIPATGLGITNVIIGLGLLVGGGLVLPRKKREK